MPPRFKPPNESVRQRRGSRRVPPLLGVFALSCALFSCAFRTTKQPATPPGSPSTIQAARAVETRIGVIRAVGPDQRFVLIETPSTSASDALSEGLLLHCRPPGSASLTATADLRVSRERRQSLVVANVVSGEPVAGGIVFADPVATPTPAPSPDSISSVSTVPLPSLFPRRTP